jgi:hypothetical protein
MKSMLIYFTKPKSSEEIDKRRRILSAVPSPNPPLLRSNANIYLLVTAKKLTT